MAVRTGRTRLICALTATDTASMRAEMGRAFAAGADAVECRLDFLREAPSQEKLAALLRRPRGEVIVTCRPQRAGGRYQGEESTRLAMLAWAGQLGADFVDVELDVPPASWPKARIILSHHDFTGGPKDLEAVVAALEKSPAQVAKIALMGEGPEEAFGALEVLRGSNKPTISLCMGQAGLLSRVLARKFGAFGTFASLSSGRESAPGQPSLEEFRELYRWESIGAKTQVLGVIGCPVGHSMSPAVHNRAFDVAGVDAVYLPVLIQPGRARFERFMDALMARPWLDWRGLSVTIPHKENALAWVGPGRCDELAGRIGAVNTLTISPTGEVRGYNTDCDAAVEALCAGMGISRAELGGISAAIIGAGGVARAIVAGLRHYGADVTIYNRTLSRAEALAEEFGCRAAELPKAQSTEAEVLVNCTSVGMHPHVDATPVKMIPPTVKAVFDTVYNPLQTRLLTQAREAGAVTISGLEMFLNQAAAQFELWTGRPAPRQAMSAVLLERLGRTE